MTAPYAPTFRTPAAQGLLTNKRGSNFTTDAISISARYGHPQGASTDSPSALQVKGYRTAAQGVPQPAELVWDSGVVGLFPFTQPSGLPAPGKAWPVAGTVSAYPSCKADGGGGMRIYCTFGTYRIYSAPLLGGSWRMELDLTAISPVSYYTGLAATWDSQFGVPNQLLVLGQPGSTNPYRAYISLFCFDTSYVMNQARFSVAADGSLAFVPYLSWQPLQLINGWGPGATVYGDVVIPGPMGAGSGAAGYGQNALACGAVYGDNPQSAAFVYTFSSDGTCTNVETSGIGGVAPLPAVIQGHAGFYDPVAQKYYVIGGDDSSTSKTAIYASTTPSCTAWTTLATGLPAARTRHAVVVGGNYVYVVGGSAGAGVGTSTVYYHLISTLGTAWSTGNGLPAAMMDMTAIPISSTLMGVYGGTYQQGFSQGSAMGAGGNGGWYTQASALTAATLGGAGNGGSFVVNPNGTADVGFNYGAVGVAPISTLSDGDQVQLNLTLYDQLKGDVSPVSTTVLKVGQPPVLTSLVPANASTVTTGRPTVSFGVNPGVGGAQQKSYRVVVAQAGTTVYDSGLKYDGANSVVVKPTSGPALSNLAYTLTVTVTMFDATFPGSTNTVTSSTTFNGPTTAVPAAPTAVTAVPDGLNGWVLIGWTVPAACTYIRIYMKAAGAPLWMLYKDNLTPLGAGNAQTFQAMDDIALNTAYDYAVSSVNAAGVESLLATDLDVAGSNTITPPKQPSNVRYSIMLHVVGNGPAQKVGLQIVVIGSRGHAADIVTEQDAQMIVGFGAKAGTIRTGIYQYRRISLKPIFIGAAQLAAVEAVMVAAMTGVTLCYRDTLGTVIYCGPAAARTRHEGHDHEDDLALIETSYRYTP